MIIAETSLIFTALLGPEMYNKYDESWEVLHFVIEILYQEVYKKYECSWDVLHFFIEFLRQEAYKQYDYSWDVLHFWYNSYAKHPRVLIPGYPGTKTKGRFRCPENMIMGYKLRMESWSSHLQCPSHAICWATSWEGSTSSAPETNIAKFMPQKRNENTRKLELDISTHATVVFSHSNGYARPDEKHRLCAVHARLALLTNRCLRQ